MSNKLRVHVGCVPESMIQECKAVLERLEFQGDSARVGVCGGEILAVFPADQEDQERLEELVIRVIDQQFQRNHFSITVEVVDFSRRALEVPVGVPTADQATDVRDYPSGGFAHNF